MLGMHGKFTENLHPRGHGGKFVKGLPKILNVRDRNRAISTMSRFRHHVLSPDNAGYYHIDTHRPNFEHQHAVFAYFDGGFHEVNAALRAGTDHPDVGEIRAAMQPLQHDLVVSRHIDGHAFGIDNPDDLPSLTGKKITDPGFQAASLTDEQNMPGATLHIAAPKGTTAAMSGDGQILLDHGSELAVTSVEKNEAGGWDLHAVLLPKTAPRAARTASKAEPGKPETPATPDAASHFDGMTVPQLREEVRKRGIRGHSRLKKADLLALLKADEKEAARPESPAPGAAKASTDGKTEPDHVAELRLMINAKDSRQAWERADRLKGAKLDAAVAAIPPSYRSHLTKSSRVDAKRQALVNWSQSNDQMNSEAVRALGEHDPERRRAVLADERAARHTELDHPSVEEPKSPKPRAAAKASPAAPKVTAPKVPAAPKKAASKPTASEKPIAGAANARVVESLQQQIKTVDKAGGNSGKLHDLLQKAESGKLSERELRDTFNSLAITRMAATGGNVSTGEAAERDAGRAVLDAATGVESVAKAPDPSAHEQLRASIKSGIKERTTLSGGRAAKTELATTADGRKVVIKGTEDVTAGMGEELGGAKRQQDAEELVAALAAKLGLNAPAVVRMAPDQVAMQFMSGRTGEQLSDGEMEALTRSRSAKLIDLLDQVVDNVDRNPGNYLVEGDRIAPIDHGFSFGFKDGPESPVKRLAFGADHAKSEIQVEEHLVNGVTKKKARTVRSFKDMEDVSSADLRRLRDYVQEMQAEFDRLGRPDWFEKVMQRIDAMMPHAKGTKQWIEA